MNRFSKYVLRALLPVAVVAMTSPAMAFQCRKGSDRLDISVGTHLGGGPTFYGVQLNGQLGQDALNLLSNLVTTYGRCKPLSTYTRPEHADVLLCNGELFVLNAAFGQTILTNGAGDIFKKMIAPADGWKCD